MRCRTVSGYLLFTVAVAAWSGPARAQTSADDPPAPDIELDAAASNGDDTEPAFVLDPTIVSATPVPQAQSTLGSSVTVIGAAELAERGITDVRDALEIAPGTHVGQTGTRGSLASLFLRGGESDFTLVLIDGVPVNQVGGFFDFGRLTLDDVERIEVLRGAQSALYGSEAMSGVVNIITKRGDGPPTWSWDAAAGTRHTYRTTGTFSGGSDRGHYRVTVSRHSTTNRQRLKDDAFRQYTLSGRAGFRPVDDVELEGTFRVENVDRENPGQHSRPGFIEDRNDHTDDDQVLLGGTVTHHLRDWWEHRVQVSFFREELANDDPSQENPPGALASTDFITTESLVKTERTLVDYRHSVTLLEDHIATVGVSYEQEWARITRLAPPFPAGFGNSHLSRTIENRAVYAQLQATFLDDTLHLQAGVRHDNNSFFDEETSPRVAGSYRVEQTDSRVHASWGRGIKTPNLFEMLSPGGLNLEAEETDHWDVGVEQRLWDDRLVLDVTYFAQDIDNIVEFQSVFPFGVDNGGEVETKGIEVSGTARLRPDLLAYLAYTYLETERKSPPRFPRVGNGQSLDRRPKHQATARVTYRPDPWSATVDVRYVGDSNEPDAFDPFTFASLPVENEDYWLVNLSGAYQVNDHLELYSVLTNLLNDNYENVFGFEANGLTALFGARGSF